ncbi:MAG TPA: hypothetical protein VFB02_13980 [Bradyrhizobium sp.]|nr:hypothetical protein [Bradyrhizobium sp.]
MSKSAIELDAEASELEARALQLRRDAASRRDRDREVARLEAAKIPVDRSARTLVDGSPVTKDHRELKPNGQQKDYVVLSEAERAKGFVRPVRRSYIHTKCGVLTTMSQAIAETYARDPYFYSGTFCCGCGSHFPVGDDGEFTWADAPNEKVGT